MKTWVSGSCVGECCHIHGCKAPAFAKVGEEISGDDPAPARHNLTAYVCRGHFTFIFGEVGVNFRDGWLAGAVDAEPTAL